MNRQSKGDRTRADILALAMEASTIHGLHSLTIGKLSSVLGMSRSGLLSHFGTKEELQLAVVEYARKGFVEDVFESTDSKEHGLERLASLFQNWMKIVAVKGREGGCFFIKAFHETSSEDGRLHKRLSEIGSEFESVFEREARLAVRLGELRQDAKPEVLTFYLAATVEGIQLRKNLFNEPTLNEFGMERILTILRFYATTTGKSVLANLQVEKD
ncbi:MAG: TetR/AcrR family transcriptional regulator [Pyrinomonadaceae bacterium]